MREILKVEGLTKSYTLLKKQQQLQKTAEKKLIAVNDLSFSAYEGEIFGLLGPNGAGKTTTLRIISTLIKADGGDVFLDGNSVREKPDYTRSKIGFLTSELKLEGFFTPNYLFDFFSDLHNIDKAVTLERKKMLFAKFGIDKFAEVKVANLSTGMMQKVSLVLSIAHDPEIIIFDEPTNGLDVIVAKSVTDFLIDLKNAGKSIILSTHIFSLAERLCDRVGVMIDGKLVKCDTLAAIQNGTTLEDSFFELYKQYGKAVD